MKVLVYGIGVIGSLTVHELCKNGHEVTIVARGQRKERIENNGFRVRIGKQEWVDQPRVISEYDGNRYDVTFSIMQSQQQEQILGVLSAIRTDKIVLIGNNMTCSEMEEELENYGVPASKIYFGFQTTGGNRYDDYTEVVTFGKANLTLGHLHNELDEEEKLCFNSLFDKKTMKIDYMDDMDSWCKCHMGFILPIAYLAYAHHCDLRECTLKEMKQYMLAGAEVYKLYQSLGIKIRPKGDEKNTRGVRMHIYAFSMWMVGKSKMGEEAITNHCRNAVDEMQYMEEKLENLRKKKPEIEMPLYDALKNGKPNWDELRDIYR